MAVTVPVDGVAKVVGMEIVPSGKEGLGTVTFELRMNVTKRVAFELLELIREGPSIRCRLELEAEPKDGIRVR